MNQHLSKSTVQALVTMLAHSVCTGSLVQSPDLLDGVTGAAGAGAGNGRQPVCVHPSSPIKPGRPLASPAGKSGLLLARSALSYLFTLPLHFTPAP